LRSFVNYGRKKFCNIGSRSLLANINGVANSGSSGGSSANTPSEPGGVGVGLLHNFPSLSNGTAADHLPPLKNSGVGGVSTSNNKISSNSIYDGHYNNYVYNDLDSMSNGAGSISNGLTNGHGSTVSSATRWQC
jgi:hypothetical protein